MGYTEYEDSYDSDTEDSEQQQEVNAVHQDSCLSECTIQFEEYEDSDWEGPDFSINMIETSPEGESSIGMLQAEAGVPHIRDDTQPTKQVSDARLMLLRSAAGRAHTIGNHCLTKVHITLLKKKYTVDVLLDSGAA